MIFKELPLSGAYILDIEKNSDGRGFFARTWCRNEFKQNNLDTDLAQFSISFNIHTGTLRGMHFQVSPNEETKIVQCITGSIHDVIIDLRKNSNTFMKSYGIELTAQNKTMLYIPKGFAHGFITLEDNTEVFYHISDFYAPQSARGFRWNDPTFELNWPIKPTVMSEKDKNYPDFNQRLLLS